MELKQSLDWKIKDSGRLLIFTHDSDRMSIFAKMPNYSFEAKSIRKVDLQQLFIFPEARYVIYIYTCLILDSQQNFEGRVINCIQSFNFYQRN